MPGRHPLAHLLDPLEHPAILLARDYRVMAFNALYAERYGVPAVGTQRCHEISHRYDTPCDLNGEDCPLRASLETAQPHRVTHVHHTPRGPEHCDILMKPLRDSEGAISHFIEIIQPIEIAAASPTQGVLLGRSRAFNDMITLVERVAPSEVPALLLGESGTGKELLARAIHDRSARARGPFVPLECSGLSNTLFESELFGHEQGAFTGASRTRQGLVEEARGGTLFLDEIGDISLDQQVKLLRLLESGTYRRVGGGGWLRADFRLVAATHRDLKAMVAEGSFRQDLYYRVNVFPILLSPLRERREDIPLIATSFLESTGTRKRPRPDTLTQLMRWSFPGNIRELRNVLERAVLVCDGEWITPRHLPGEIRYAAPSAPGPRPWGDGLLTLAEVERRYLRWASARTPNRAALAEALGVSERTLYRKLQGIGQEPGQEPR